MLITNGIVTRNIEAEKLPEYQAKGYAAVEEAAAQPTPKKRLVKKAGGK